MLRFQNLLYHITLSDLWLDKAVCENWLVKISLLQIKFALLRESHTVLLTNKVTLNNTNKYDLKLSRARNFQLYQTARVMWGYENDVHNSQKVRYRNRKGPQNILVLQQKALFGYFSTFHINITVT